MKKWISMCLSMLIMISSIGVSFAADNELTNAEKLNKLNLIYGSDGSFQLDAKLKRNEAAAFIIRVLGKEQYVIDKNYANKPSKFSDVATGTWYTGYVNYAVEQGIILGFPTGKFEPDTYLSEKSFLSLILGALGYRANVDYTWDTIYAKAYEIGVVTDRAYATKKIDNVEYKRNDVVDVIYKTLDMKVNGSERTIISRLIDNGAASTDMLVAAGLITDELTTTITSIQVMNQNQVKLIFNEKIKEIEKQSIVIKNENNIELSISSIQLTDNELMVNTDTQKPGSNYSVSIAGIKDSNDFVTSQVTTTFYGFANIEMKSNYFKVSKVEAVSRNLIEVYFTQPITLAAGVGQFYDVNQDGKLYIDGSFSNIKGTLINNVNNAVQLWFTGEGFSTGTLYELKLSADISSIYGVRLGEGNGDSIQFVGSGNSNSIPDVVRTEQEDQNFIYIEFDRDVDISSAQTITNYTLKNITTDTTYPNALQAKFYGEGKLKQRAVRVRFPQPIQENHQYELTIKPIQDSFKELSSSQKSYSFIGAKFEQKDLAIEYASAIDSQTVGVYFNKPIEDPSSATFLITASGYAGTATKVYYNRNENASYVKLYLNSALTSSNNYTIKVVSGLKDFLLRPQVGTPEYNFQGSDNELIKPVLVDAVLISKNQVKLTYNEDISPTLNVLSSNYKLEYKDNNDTKSLTVSSVGITNSRTVILTVDNIDKGREYVVKSTNVWDYSGQTKLDTTSSTLLIE